MEIISQIVRRIGNIRYALEGLIYAWKEEINIRLEVFFMGNALILAFLHNAPAWSLLLLGFVFAMTLCLELVNSAIEQTMNLVQPNQDNRVKIIKDLASAAVFIPGLFFTLLWFYIMLGI